MIDLAERMSRLSWATVLYRRRTLNTRRVSLANVYLNIYSTHNKVKVALESLFHVRRSRALPFFDGGQVNTHALSCQQNQPLQGLPKTPPFPGLEKQTGGFPERLLTGPREVHCGISQGWSGQHSCVP